VSAVSVFHKAAKPILEKKTKNQEYMEALRNQHLHFVHSISVKKIQVYFFIFFNFLLLSRKENLNATSSSSKELKTEY
jgi:hypothetical protein